MTRHKSTTYTKRWQGFVQGEEPFTYADGYPSWSSDRPDRAVAHHYPCHADVARGEDLPSALSPTIHAPLIRPAIAQRPPASREPVCLDGALWKLVLFSYAGSHEPSTCACVCILCAFS
jgi:hypothetical protein